MRTVYGLAIAGAGFAALGFSLPDVAERPLAQRWHGEGLQPAAALAWVQTHCIPDFRLRPGTPRLQAEDLLRASAEFDRLVHQFGPEATCGLAIKLAQGVAEADVAATPTIARPAGEAASSRQRMLGHLVAQ